MIPDINYSLRLILTESSLSESILKFYTFECKLPELFVQQCVSYVHGSQQFSSFAGPTDRPPLRNKTCQFKKLFTSVRLTSLGVGVVEGDPGNLSLHLVAWREEFI